jgi:bifunctional non-homologous end joining protein LigD
MLPTLISQPVHRQGWVYQEKPDGYRILAFKDGERVRLVSRAGKDHSARFQGLVDAIRSLPHQQLVLDGEVARYDEHLVSRFEWLRMSPNDEIATPPMFMAFDLLQVEWDDLRPQPLRVRLERLEGVLDRAPALILPVRQLSEDGLKAWQEVLDRGYEGLVLKDPESPYVAGRSLKWLKVKQANYRVEERGWHTP